MKKLFLILCLLFAPSAWAQCTSGLDPTSVQNAINAAAPGATVTLPAGSCTWTSGVSISGKGIHVQGAGSGRIVGYSLTPLTLATGTKSIVFAPTNVAGTMPVFSNGQALILRELAFFNNFLQGTVTSYNATTGALSLNITSVGGTCGGTGTEASISNCARWLVSTEPSVTETKLINNVCGTSGGCAGAENGAMFTITVDGTVNTSISGIHFANTTAGNGPGDNLLLNTNGGLGPVGGKSIVIQNNMFELGIPSFINSHTTQAVISNNSFVDNRWQSQFAAIRLVDSGGNIGDWAWTTPSFWGTADTTGQNNLYFETNDVEGLSTGTDFDSGARAVYRYNYVNESTIGTHGAETSPYGMRYVEFYGNTFVHESNAPCVPAGCPPGFPDSDFSLANGWINQRGGSIVWWNNIIPQITGGYPKGDFALQMQMLNRHGVHSCWGIGTTGGVDYYAPRQVGMGRVTGTGSTSGVDQSCIAAGNPTGCSATNVFGPASRDSFTYVGDSEPLYIWGNGRSVGGAPFTPSLGVGGINSGTSGACTNPPNPDDPNNYVKLGRDYFMASNETLGSTTGAKPGYTPFAYPHPLVSGSATPPAVSLAPTSINFGNVAIGQSSASQSVILTNSGGTTLNITSITLTGTNPASFTITSNGCGATLTTLASCTVQVKANPPQAVNTANLHFVTNASSSPNDVPLSVTGTSVSIPAVPTGLTAVANGSTVNLSWTASTGTVVNYVVGRATVTGGPYTTIGTPTTTTFADTGRPNGTYFYVVAASNSAGTSANSTQASVTVSTSCNIQLNPVSLNFGPVIIGDSSPQTFSVTNTGTASCSSLVVNNPSGPNGADFSQVNTCGATLAVNASCIVTVTFAPSAAITENASIAVASNDPSSPDTASLTGIGVVATQVSPASLSFGRIFTNKSSAFQTVTFTNISSSTITLSDAITGGDSSQFAKGTDGCTGTLLSQASCTVQVKFAPTTTGDKTSALVFTYTGAPGSPVSVPLTGTGSTHKVRKGVTM